MLAALGRDSFRLWQWIGFLVFIAIMVGIDLGVFNRRSHVIGMKETIVRFGVWFGLALLFNVGIELLHERGAEAGLE